MKWISVKEKLPEPKKYVLVCERVWAPPGTPAPLEVTTMACHITEPTYPGDCSPLPRWEVKANGGGYEWEPDDCTPEYWMEVEPPKEP